MVAWGSPLTSRSFVRSFVKTFDLGSDSWQLLEGFNPTYISGYFVQVICLGTEKVACTDQKKNQGSSLYMSKSTDGLLKVLISPM